MAENGSIQLEGLQDVLRALGAKRVEINRAASLGLRKAGLGIIGTAQLNLRANRSWVTGVLANSGRVIYGGQGYDTGSIDARTSREASDSLMGAGASGMDIGLDVGFFDRDATSTGYAAYVEYGRRAGRFPPVKNLEEWVYKKLRVRDRKEAHAIGFLIARNIAHHGTRPHPFFHPAVQKYIGAITKILTDAVKRVIG